MFFLHGKFKFYLILGLVGFCLFPIIFLPIIAHSRKAGFPASTNKAIDHFYADPSNYFEQPDEHEIYYRVYGKYLTWNYRTPGSRIEYFLPGNADRFVEADPTETVVLPDGSRIRLAGIQIFPKRTGIPGQNDKLSPEKVYLHPEGRWMTHDECVSLNRFQGKDWNNSVPNMGGHNGLPWRIKPMFLHDTPVGCQIRDSKTGGLGSLGVSTSKHALSEDEIFTHLTGFSIPYSGIRPTHLNAHIWAWSGEPEVIEIPVTELPQTYEYEGSIYTIHQITIEDPVTEEKVVRGDPDYRRKGSIMLPYADHTRIVFDQVPGAARKMEILNQKSEIVETTESIYLDTMVSSKPEEMHTLRILLYPELTHVVFKLPEFPIIPEQNYSEQDMMNMVLPDNFTITNADRMNVFMGELYQMQYNGLGMRRITNPWPVDFSGWKVRDVLEWETAQYPPHEISMIQTERATYGISRVDRGSTVDQYGNPMEKAIWSLSQKPQILYTITAILILIKALTMAIASRLQKYTTHQGYELGFWDVEKLFAKLGTKAWNLPHHDEIAAIPGYDPSSADGVLDFLQRYKDWKKSGA